MTRKEFVLGAIALSLIVGCGPRGAEAERFAGTPEVVDDSVLLFPSGARYATGLRSVRYHDALASAGGAPFVVLSGVALEEPGEERIVVVARPEEPGASSGAERRVVFPYPGRQVDPSSPDSVQADIRLFVGECVYGGYGGVVQVTTTADTAATETVVANQIAGDSLELATGEAAPSLSDVLAAVEQGRCREIPRLDRAVSQRSTRPQVELVCFLLAPVAASLETRDIRG
ncbi:MAG TPA: hypothetical protein VMM18_12945 [Gemmatimonadaceae bacterium]|nr:hypothetical protein [Gemmatimonadaceae bacterium]